MRSLVAALVAVLFGAVAPSASAQADRMRFSISGDQSEQFEQVTMDGALTVYAEGAIAEGDTARFLKFISDKKIEAAIVQFNSSGGSLVEGIILGQAIRERGFSSRVGNSAKGLAICASACVYAYAGGVRRYFDPDAGRIGVHQFYSTSGDIDAGVSQRLSALVVSHLMDMGIDPRAFVVAAASNPDEIEWLSGDQATALGLVNNGSLATTAEIKIADMRHYLKLEQVHHDVTARVIVLCMAGRIALQFGIVTSAQDNSGKAEWSKRTYIELGDKELQPIAGATGMSINDATVWIQREFSAPEVVQLRGAPNVSGWVDGFGALRWGATLDLTNVRRDLTGYLEQCRR